jgi:hypothetical protein
MTLPRNIRARKAVRSGSVGTTTSLTVIFTTGSIEPIDFNAASAQDSIWSASNFEEF